MHPYPIEIRPWSSVYKGIVPFHNGRPPLRMQLVTKHMRPAHARNIVAVSTHPTAKGCIEVDYWRHRSGHCVTYTSTGVRPRHVINRYPTLDRLVCRSYAQELHIKGK